MTQDESTTASRHELTKLSRPLYLLRASGLAVDPRKMLLGGFALVLLAAGDWLFGFLPFESTENTIVTHRLNDSTVASRALVHAGFLPRQSGAAWLSWDAATYSLLTPIRTVVGPGRVLLQVNNSWSSLAFAWTQLLWTLTVWSLIGGALCRMNALQFAVRKRISVREAFGFSQRQLIACLIAPLLPLSAILILQGFNWLLGCLASLVPSVGAVALGIGWGLVLFCGFLMAMLLSAIATGWPLMIAAICTEDSDGFDGLSRVFGYLFDRPWTAAVLVVSSLPVFAVARFFVALLIGLTISLGAQAVSGGFTGSAGGSPLSDYEMASDESGPAGSVADHLEAALTASGTFTWPRALPELGIFVWTCIPALMYVGFGPSFFWAAATVTYFLLRESDDGTPLNAVVDWPPKPDPEATPGTKSEVEEPTIEPPK